MLAIKVEEEQPKEALTQIENENKPIIEKYGETKILEAVEPNPLATKFYVIHNEVVEAKSVAEGEFLSDVEQKLKEYDIPKEFVEKYGLEIALLYCQDKIDINKLVEKFGLKHRWYYSFQELENNLIKRLKLARAVDYEGGIYVGEDRAAHCLHPSIQFNNTSKGLTEEIMPLMGFKKLPNPHSDGNPAHAGKYRLVKNGIPAIVQTILIRPYLLKKENIEAADRTFELFKERATIPCDESGNPTPVPPRPEPKYMIAQRLDQAKVSKEEIAQRLGCKIGTVYSHLWHAQHPELYIKRERERRLKRKMSGRLINAS